MPVRMITPKIIEIGTGFFMLLASGHYDLPDRNATLVKAVSTANQTVSAEAAEPEQTDSFNLQASTISVSCIKLTWNGDEETEYTVTLTQTVPDDYIDNVYFEFKSNTLCYVTGLRENTAYQFDISDSDGNVITETTGKTETVEVIQEYAHEDG